MRLRVNVSHRSDYNENGTYCELPADVADLKAVAAFLNAIADCPRPVRVTIGAIVLEVAVLSEPEPNPYLPKEST